MASRPIPDHGPSHCLPELGSNGISASHPLRQTSLPVPLDGSLTKRRGWAETEGRRGSGGGREQGAWKTTLVAVWRTKRERFPAQPYSLGTRTRVHGQASRSRCGIEDRQDGICHLPNGYYVLLFKPIISSSPYNNPVKISISPTL